MNLTLELSKVIASSLFAFLAWHCMQKWITSAFCLGSNTQVSVFLREISYKRNKISMSFSHRFGDNLPQVDLLPPSLPPSLSPLLPLDLGLFPLESGFLGSLKHPGAPNDEEHVGVAVLLGANLVVGAEFLKKKSGYPFFYISMR